MISEIFNKTKDIIINADIDGFLSGMILQKYYGCNVVGFSNSWDCVWITPEYESSNSNALYKPVYIDLYVVNPDVICIEQHIIGYDDAHNKRLSSLGTKINPNLMCNGRTFTGDYFHKYPFGTVHFLIALLEREGVHVQLPSLDSITGQIAKNYNLTVGDILLRADDALFSSLGKYKSNTEKWWPWLFDFSGNADSINAMMRYVCEANPNNKFKVKDRTGEYFTREFQCSGMDGEYKNITDNNGNLLSCVLKYRDEICNMMNMSLDIPLIYNIHQGNASTKKYLDTSVELDYQHNPDLYSYAFIYGPRSPKDNFSFTIDMQ
ncbi:MAG: hypothetical protein J6W43_10105 [Prevotella sp.]|nr:hypothetical protein [Prevotella sp.]